MQTYNKPVLSHLSVFRLVLFAFSLALAGCGGGGGQASNQQNPTAVSVVLASNAQPGEVVLLRSQNVAGNSTPTSYQWKQTAGTPVLLSGAKAQNASFVMPPVNQGANLTFIVSALHSDGSTQSETHTVTASDQQHKHQSSVVTSQYVVFLADKDLNGRTDLYLAMLDGTAAYRLNDSLVPGSNVWDFEISPDRHYVAYSIAYPITSYSYYLELYVAHADGSGVKKVFDNLVLGGSVQSYVWAPDSSRITYLATQNTTNAPELFSSKPDGSGNVRVSAPLVSGGYVWYYSWAPDSSRIAYSASQNTAGVTELFTSHPDGTGNVRVSGPLVAGGYLDAYNFAWAPDSTRIAYAASQLTTRTFEIFTSYPDGSGNVRVSHSLSSVNDFIGSGISWAPDSLHIAYLGYYHYVGIQYGIQYNYFASNLYTTRPDGTGATQVSAIPLINNQYRHLYNYSWAPDSSRIAYAAEQNTYNVMEIFSSSPDGSGNVRVSGSLLMGENVWSGFSWAPDSSRIAYETSQNNSMMPSGIFTSLPDGTGNVRVSGSLVTGGYVNNFAWAPDSRYLAYSANQLNAQTVELFTAAPNGSLNPRVSGQMTGTSNVQGFVWSTNGSRLVYRSDQLVNQQYELFVAAPDGSVANTNISGTLTAGGDVFGFATQ